MDEEHTPGPWRLLSSHPKDSLTIVSVTGRYIGLAVPPPRCRICGKHGAVAVGGNDQLCPDADHHGPFGCATCGYPPLTEGRRDE